MEILQKTPSAIPKLLEDIRHGGTVVGYDYINNPSITWTESDKANVSRLIFHNVHGLLKSISVSILNDGNSSNDSYYAIVYATNDHGNYGEQIGCSTNAINPYAMQGKVVTFEFDRVTISTDFFIEFYKETEWNAAQGGNYKGNFRIPARNVQSDANLLSLLNTTPLYGAINSLTRWVLAVGISYEVPYNFEAIAHLERILQKVYFLSDASTHDQYPSAKAVYSEIAKLASSVTSPFQISGSINLTSADDVHRAQGMLAADGETKMFVIADFNGTYPTKADAVLAPESVVTALSFSSPDVGLTKLLTNWEAYYKVAGSWYSQNISRYLLNNTHSQPFRTGDIILLTKRKVKAVDFIARFIDFDSINVTDSLSTAEKIAWNSYKFTIGCTGKSDGDTIKKMIESDLIHGCTDNANYTVISNEGLITMYDYKVLSQERPLKTFSGSFNSGNDCDLPGIYNNITLGRPAGSASGETYTLVVQPDGSHWAYSNTRAGHNFYRPSKFNEWVAIGIS